MPADDLHQVERIKALKLERLLLRQHIDQLDRQIAALKSQTANPLAANANANADADAGAGAGAYRMHFDSTRVIIAAVETAQTDRTPAARALDPR